MAIDKEIEQRDLTVSFSKYFFIFKIKTYIINILKNI